MTNELQYLYCEECGKHKIFYNVAKEIGWCHFCKRVVYKKELGGYGHGPDYLFDPEVSTHAVPNYPFAWWCDPARKYLVNRWVSELDSYRAGIRYDGERMAIRVPIHSPAKELPQAYQTRGIYEGGHWYTEAPNRADYCFGWPYLGDRKEILIVEGIFDLLSPGWLGLGISLLGSAISDTLVLAISQQFNSVLLWLDPDAAGRKGTNKVGAALREAGVQVSDISSGIEPGDMGPDHPLAREVVARCAY